jgi:hypothetical protein
MTMRFSHTLAGVGMLAAALGFAAPADATVVSGNIAVYRTSDDTLLGYVGTSLTVFDTYPITSSAANALDVEIDTTASVPFSLLASNPPDPSFPYIGGALGAAGNSFGPGSAAYAFLTELPLGSSSNNPIGSPGESAIWTLGANNVLSAEWTNGNTVSGPLTLFHDISFGDLDMTGDLNSFVNDFGDTVEAVTFVFTGDIPTGPTPTPEPASLALLGVGVAAVSLTRRRRCKGA